MTLAAVSAAVLLAHLVFLGAYSLVLDPKAWQSPRYSESNSERTAFIDCKDAEAIIKAEQDRFDGKKTALDVKWTSKRRAQIAFPGLNPPFGPIQKFVSEIYSLDEPPFFKHFLEFQTTPTEAVIKIHRVRGHQPLETDDCDEQVVATIKLSTGMDSGEG
jgi:hypothetical protein